jgi:hypothetical protein
LFWLEFDEIIEEEVPGDDEDDEEVNCGEGEATEM